MEKRQKINRAEQYSLLLLAGGKSSRMGRDKAELSLDGKSFLSCQVTKMEKRQKINRAEQYSLLLLAGGKSSRMGRDKAELSLDGKSFLSCQVTKAEQLAIREIFLSGHGTGKLIKERTESENRVHIHEISDIYKDRGPLGGIHACMKSMETPYCLVLPVDVPQSTESENRVHIHEISDIYKDRGPLGGIHACMKSMETPYCLVLPVDVPQIPERVLEEYL